MSDGKIEQIGAPPDIYNFPATPFVASFVGTLNLLPASVIDATAGRVSVAGQEIRSSIPIESTGTATVALRPEAVRLGESAGGNVLRGSVEDVSFLGSIVRTRIRIADDVALSFDQFNDPALAAPKIGETVAVSFPVEATLVLKGEARAETAIEEAIATS